MQQLSPSLLGTHVLDQPAWHALTTSQATLAEATGQARRYLPEVAAFGAIPDLSLESFRDLRALTSPGERVGFMTLDVSIAPPADLFEVSLSAEVIQMIHPGGLKREAAGSFAVLGADDVPAMLDLVERTHPGPFGPRTIEMGRYLGIRDADTLLAMSGERFRLPGFVELSAVCTDPAARGRGYASALIGAVGNKVQERDEHLFLHVFATNTSATRLYEALGFVARAAMRVTVLAPVE